MLAALFMLFVSLALCMNSLETAVKTEPKASWNTVNVFSFYHHARSLRSFALSCFCLNRHLFGSCVFPFRYPSLVSHDAHCTLSPSEPWPRKGPEHIQRHLPCPPSHRDSSRRELCWTAGERHRHRAETHTQRRGLSRATPPTATEVPLRPTGLSTWRPWQLRNVGTPQASFWPGASRKVGLLRRWLTVFSQVWLRV